MYRESVSTFADLSVTLGRPEGSFLAPEISRLFGDTVDTVEPPLFEALLANS